MSSLRSKSYAAATVLARAEKAIWGQANEPAPGFGLSRVVSAQFDASAHSALRPTNTYGLGIRLPGGAVIKQVWYEVITTFTTASSDAGTIAIVARTSPVTTLQAATSVVACANIWDKGMHLVASSPLIKLAVETDLGVVVAGQALTAGKMNIFVEYVMSADETVSPLAPVLASQRVIVKGVFDPETVVGARTTAAHGTGAFVPNGAIVVASWYDVSVTFVSAGADAGTIALSVQSANDLVTAIAISDGTNPWDAGMHPVTVTPLKTTADREVVATVAGQALTHGTMNVFVEYILV